MRPDTGEVVYLVVRRGWTDRLLHVAAAQVDRIDGDGAAVRLRVTRGEAERLSAGVPQEAADGAGARQSATG